MKINFRSLKDFGSSVLDINCNNMNVGLTLNLSYNFPHHIDTGQV